MTSKYLGKLILGLAAAYSLAGCASKGKAVQKEDLSYEDKLSLETIDVNNDKLEDLLLTVKHKDKSEKALLFQYKVDDVSAFANYNSLATQKAIEAAKQAKQLEARVSGELEEITGRKPLILNSASFRQISEVKDNVIFYKGDHRTVFSGVYLKDGIAIKTISAKGDNWLIVFIKEKNGSYTDLGEVQKSKYDSTMKEIEEIQKAVKDNLLEPKQIPRRPVEGPKPKTEDIRKKLLENPK